MEEPTHYSEAIYNLLQTISSSLEEIKELLSKDEEFTIEDTFTEPSIDKKECKEATEGVIKKTL